MGGFQPKFLIPAGKPPINLLSEGFPYETPVWDVDDILIAAMPDELEALQQALSVIFPISDWEEDTFDYIGSQVEQRDGKILISQENYVDSRLETIEIPKGVVMDDLGDEAGQSEHNRCTFLACFSD